MSHRRFQFRPQLEAFENRLCPSGSTVVLPISAFLAQQGHDAFFTYPTGVPDSQGWNNSTLDPGATPTDPTRLILVDYAGVQAKWLNQNYGINLHTTVTGFVTETPLGSTGRMEVSLDLEATNALTWVANINGFDPITANAQGTVLTMPLELGYRADELVGHPERHAALSNVHMQETWVENVGANLPDLARLNEDYAAFAPPGFSYERFNFQSWGTGTLRDATTVGTPGNTAIASTWQVADVTNSSLPGTLADGFWQEPIDIIPVASASTHVGYLNGTLFVLDMTNGNDHVTVSPTGGGVTLSSNLGNGTYTAVTRVVTALGNGNNHVQVGNLPGVTVDVVGLDGNNNFAIGNVGKLVVSVGQGNNNIATGNSSAAQFIGVSGHGNNQIDVESDSPAEILVFGSGNNHVRPAATATSSRCSATATTTSRTPVPTTSSGWGATATTTSTTRAMVASLKSWLATATITSVASGDLSPDPKHARGLVMANRSGKRTSRIVEPNHPSNGMVQKQVTAQGCKEFRGHHT